MSRSRRKAPVTPRTTAQSEKDDKRIWHRRWRRAVRRAIEREEEILPHHRQVSDPWVMAKDGRYWRSRPEPRDWRK